MRFVGLEAFLSAGADAMPYGALKRLEIARALAAKPSVPPPRRARRRLNPVETEEIDERLIARSPTAASPSSSSSTT